MRINVLTLFPDMFGPVVSESILGRACRRGLLEINRIDIRDFTLDRHNRTDDTPFGGGEGMVLSAQPVSGALRSLRDGRGRVLYLSPRGRMLDQALIEELAEEESFTLLCGHYEGIDQRVLDHYGAEEISIGDYILTGGELPAMVVIDAVARLIPEVIGSSDSMRNESIYSGLLEHPHYTKPREWEGSGVPEVLLSGDHRRIRLWRYEQSLRLTAARRPDLLEAYLRNRPELAKDEKKVLEAVLNEREGSEAAAAGEPK